MNQFISLTRRNCKIYLKDRGAVFFSLLSMLIVLMLMAVFLGDMNVNAVTDLLSEYGGARDSALDEENAMHLVQYWTLAGIMMVNAVTVTMTVIGNMVNDGSEDKLASFYCAPVSRFSIAMSYITSAVLVGSLFILLTLAVFLGFVAAAGGEMLTASAILQTLGYGIINVIIFAVIMYMLALCAKSASAWSGFGTLVGTLVGFVGAIYLPMGSLPEGVGTVLKYLPFLHGTSLMRKVCCEAAIETTFAGMPAELAATYKEAMGITVSMGDEPVSSTFQVCFLLGYGMIALIILAVLAKKRNVGDR